MGTETYIHGSQKTDPGYYRDRSIVSVKRSALLGLIAFLILAVLIGAIIFQRYISLKEDKKDDALSVANNARVRLQESLAFSLSATNTLSFFIQNDGSVKNFDSIASQILHTTNDIDALELVPAGVIRYIYPFKGNEKAIGYNILKDPARRKEAIKAIEKKELFFAGPFQLIQGGMGVVGRLPIFRNGKFWGFSAVVIKMPALLRSAGIDSTGNSGYYFQLSKINPDTNEEDFFIRHPHKLSGNYAVSVNVPNGEWKLSVIPVKPFEGFADILILGIIGLLFSILCGFYVFSVSMGPKRLDDLVLIRSRQLKESEQKYRSLIEQASDGIIITDFNGNILEVNKSIAGMGNYNIEDMPGKNVKEFIPPEDIEANPFRFEELRKGGSLLHERRFLKKDGSFVDVEVNSKLTGSNTLIGFIRDISERKKNEAILRYQAKLLDSVSDAITSLDMNRCIVSWNKACEDLYGLTTEEAMGKRIPELVTFEYPNFTNDEVFKQVFSVGSWKGEFNFIHPKTNIKTHLLSSINLLKNADGKMTGLIITSGDITERKKTELALKKSNERFELIAQATNDAIWDHDFSKNETWGNKKLYSLYGIEPGKDKINFEMFLGRIHPDERDAVAERMKIAIGKSVTSLSEEFRFKTADNVYRDFYDRAYIKYDEEGKPIRVLGAMEDITDRETIKNQILKEKELSDSIVNSLPGIFYLYNKEGKFLRWNKNFELVSGYNADEINRMHPLDFFDQVDQAMLKAKIENVFVEGFDYAEANFLLKNKQKVPYYFTGQAIEYEGEICLMGVGLDFSEREKAARIISESEERYRTLVEQASDGIFIADKQGHFLMVNSSGFNISQYSMEELKNMTIYDLVLPEDLIKDPFHFSDMDNNKVARSERRMKRKDGTLLDIEITAKFISGDRFLAFIRDVSERKKADKALRESEERYRALVENATEALVVMDVEKQVFVSVSESATKLFRMTREELLTIGLAGVSPEFQPDGRHSAEVAMEYIQKAIEGEKPVFEWTHRDKEGNLVPCEVWLVRLPSENKVLIRGSIVDITERKKAAEEIRANSELLLELYSYSQNIREEERTHIAREIHDELGQQLTGLKMDISWITRRLKTTDEAIMEKLTGTLSLIDTTIKTVRKIATELRPSILDDLGLVAALEWQGEEFGKRSDIKVNFTSNLDETILQPGISTALFRIYQELLTNVARHASAGIVNTAIYISEHKLHLSVEDNGTGFDTADISSKKTLGLRGIKERTNLIGGSYEIKTKPGVGTFVLISVPL